MTALEEMMKKVAWVLVSKRAFFKMSIQIVTHQTGVPTYKIGGLEGACLSLDPIIRSLLRLSSIERRVLQSPKTQKRALTCSLEENTQITTAAI